MAREVEHYKLEIMEVKMVRCGQQVTFALFQ